MIPVMKPLLPTEEQVAPWLRQMDESRVYTNLGPLVRELERQHAARLNIGADHVVSVANATLGLVGAVELSPVQRWIVPDFTFPATGHAILQAGRELVLADIDPTTWQLDLGNVQEVPDAGIMPVLPFGAPLSFEDWSEFTRVVVDAAASLGADGWDLADLPSTWAVVFSLHATKTLPAGEGGLVVFGDPDQAARFRAWSNFGFAGTRLSALVGTNAKMPEVTAAYGLASLQYWTEERAEWISNLQRANRIARDLGIDTPVQANVGAHPYWIVQMDSEITRDRIVGKLEAESIESRLWWPVPLHEMPAFQHRVPATPSPIATHVASTTLGLPMFRGLAHADIDRVGEVLAVALRV